MILTSSIKTADIVSDYAIGGATFRDVGIENIESMKHTRIHNVFHIHSGFFGLRCNAVAGRERQLVFAGLNA